MGSNRSPKQIVYLIGAGATQAELMHRGGEKINLLMKDSKELGDGITTRILRKAKRKFKFDIPIKGETDIEKLISLLTATSIPSVVSHKRLELFLLFLRERGNVQPG